MFKMYANILYRGLVIVIIKNLKKLYFASLFS